ncbi:MAG: 2-(1,2-epoxy-1,2-dihydrophenyl)acetyl-CoA isomerase [Candidatus Lokiarchaeota archaeon]|nr:2-(1,2-epoxy-1,2-dihydrophenyl)acetyl-CoA isomerase [Candidatus Lokiarchaeota archaeon]
MNNNSYEYILFKYKDGVGKITLNRPDKLNALNYPLIMEIIEVLESTIRNKKIRAISIQGEGRHFSSGDDLNNMGPNGVRFKPLKDGSKLPHHRMIRLLRAIQKPTIALINGYCLGAGFDMALACDFRIASSEAKLGDHRASRAICVMSGGSWLLPRLIGFGRATEIILTGRHLGAKEARQIGLVTEVYNSGEFKEKASTFVNKIANLPTKCLGYNKMMLNYSQKNELFPSMLNEFKLYCKNIATKDFGEGMRSFRKKRNPKFVGR